MSSMNELKIFTREEQNAGTKIPLYDKFGEKTNEWIRIRGANSDEFRLAKSRISREMREKFDENADMDALLAEQTLKLRAALVIDWSFDDVVNKKNIKKLLTEAPQIADAIDTMASNNALFTQSELKD